MRRPAGFSLIETLVAMFILAVAVLGLYSAQAYALAAHKKSRGDYQAGSVGTSLLEELESRHRLSHQDFLADASVARTGVPGHPQLEYAVDQEYLSPAQDLKKLTVTVFSRDESGSWKAHRFWLVVSDLEAGR